MYSGGGPYQDLLQGKTARRSNLIQRVGFRDIGKSKRNRTTEGLVPRTISYMRLQLFLQIYEKRRPDFELVPIMFCLGYSPFTYSSGRKFN
jgi:hypothetical protein